MKRRASKILVVACAALTLAGCSDMAGEVANQAADLKAKAGASVEAQAVADAVVSAVDVDAARALAEGAAREALREALPVGEAAAVATIVNEQALVDGLARAVDGEADPHAPATR